MSEANTYSNIGTSLSNRFKLNIVPLGFLPFGFLRTLISKFTNCVESTKQNQIGESTINLHKDEKRIKYLILTAARLYRSVK